MILIASLLLLVLVAAYWEMFLSYFSGWSKLAKAENAVNTTVSADLFTLVIPFRNEEKNLQDFINSLENQSIDLSTQEIIFVDDHSSDASTQIVEQWTAGKDFARCISLGSEGAPGGKKKAISFAVAQSKNPYIVTTDADTVAEPKWLETLAAFIIKKSPKLVSAPVKILVREGFFNKWQSLEFSGLIAIGAACMANSKPNMCNGANMCYAKNAFYEVGGFADNDHILSGDDEFLMHKIFERYPRDVHFLFNQNAMVSTLPQDGWTNFLKQRIRWTSKAGHYKDKRITRQLILAYIFTLSIVVFTLLGLFLPNYLWLAALATLAKIIPEMLFFRKILPFFGYQRLQKILLPAEFLHVWYIVVIGVLGTFANYTWKGRSSK